MVAEAGHRRLRVHRDPGEAGGWHLGEGVHHRLADLPQRREHLLTLLLGAQERPGDRQEALTAQGLGNVGDRRQVEKPDHGGRLLGRVRRPVPVAAQPVRSNL